MKTFTPAKAIWTREQIVNDLQETANEFSTEGFAVSVVDESLITDEIAQEFVDGSYEIMIDSVDNSEEWILNAYLGLNLRTLEKIGIKLESLS